jgi:hypothetical protein
MPRIVTSSGKLEKPYELSGEAAPRPLPVKEDFANWNFMVTCDLIKEGHY